MNTVPVPTPPPGETPRGLADFVVSLTALVTDVKRLVAELKAGPVAPPEKPNGRTR